VTEPPDWWDPGEAESADYDNEDEVFCPEGFCWDECCECIFRGGIEHCEFCCPFGGVPRYCHTSECERGGR